MLETEEENIEENEEGNKTLVEKTPKVVKKSRKKLKKKPQQDFSDARIMVNNIINGKLKNYCLNVFKHYHYMLLFFRECYLLFLILLAMNMIRMRNSGVRSHTRYWYNFMTITLA